jgi:hypothetical protein
MDLKPLMPEELLLHISMTWAFPGVAHLSNPLKLVRFWLLVPSRVIVVLCCVFAPLKFSAEPRAKSAVVDVVLERAPELACVLVP